MGEDAKTKDEDEQAAQTHEEAAEEMRELEQSGEIPSDL